MKNKPLVSIIMNCFNGQKYLVHALNSVIAQTYSNWELIFWDNQSTDRSAEIIKNYNDKRFQYFYASNHTLLCEARNKAIEKTNGEYIAFLDVDDWWMPDKLEKQIPLFDDNTVGLVYGNCWIFKEKLKKKNIYSRYKLPTGSVLNEILKVRKVGLVTIVVRKKYLENLSYPFDSRFHVIGDFDLGVRMAIYWKFECVQEPIAFYRLHESNQFLYTKEREIKELETWYIEAQSNPNISKCKNLRRILDGINYIKSLQNLKYKNYLKAFKYFLKLSICIEKFKLLVALILPKKIMYILKAYDD